MTNTVIIASKRKGRDMWEGYNMVSTSDAKSYMADMRDLGRICKKFPDIMEYRKDVDRILSRLGY